MLRAQLIFVTAVAVALAAYGGAASGESTAVPTLKGTVGPGFTIALKKNGSTVKTLKTGTYVFAIADKSSIHNFTLTGGTMTKALTPTSFVGVKKVKVTLKKGKWKYFCSVHPTTMFGFFIVK